MTCARTLEQNFMDTINDNLLTQMVTEPTRLDNITDLAFVGDRDSVLHCLFMKVSQKKITTQSG